MSHYDRKAAFVLLEDDTQRSIKAFSVAAAELVHERDVLLKLLADATENCAKMRRERDNLKGQLAELENTIATLRSKGKRVVADRDRWEEVARQRASEVLELKHLSINSEKFRQAKAVISRVLHPDNAKGGEKIEKIARTAIFKEIWPEIVKIDRGEI